LGGTTLGRQDFNSGQRFFNPWFFYIGTSTVSKEKSPAFSQARPPVFTSHPADSRISAKDLLFSTVSSSLTDLKPSRLMIGN